MSSFACISRFVWIISWEVLICGHCIMFWKRHGGYHEPSLQLSGYHMRKYSSISPACQTSSQPGKYQSTESPYVWVLPSLPRLQFNIPFWIVLLIELIWQFVHSMRKHCNQLVHRAEVQESADCMSNDLQDWVKQHYMAFETDPNYILPRHINLFTRWSLDGCLSLSNYHNCCWLCSVDEARATLAYQDHFSRQRPTNSFQTPHHNWC